MGGAGRWGCLVAPDHQGDLTGDGYPEIFVQGHHRDYANDPGRYIFQTWLFLNANGTNFVPGAAVQWNGVSRATTFFSSTQLKATINNFDVATAGTASVTVLNPPTGGGTSTPLNFTIFNPPAAPNSLIITVAGNGNAGFSGDGGPAINASLNGPEKIVFDAAGNIYVADSANATIRQIKQDNTNWVVSTLPGLVAQIGYPAGVAADTNGNVYVADINLHSILKITPGNPDWIVNTLAVSPEANVNVPLVAL